MLITAVCPRCQTSYQVQDELRGRPMRCPQATCRQVFLVGAPPIARGGPGAASSAVGDLVPLVPTEPAAPVGTGTHVADLLELVPAEPVAPTPPGWQHSPPPRRPGPAPQLRPATGLAPEDGGPRVVAFDAANNPAAPPVRRGDDGVEPLEEVDGPPSLRRDDHHPAPRPRRRWIWVVASLLLLVGGTVAGGTYLALTFFIANEEKLAAEADELFDKGQFPAAASDYEKLQQNFPKSDRAPFYRYRQALSELRRRLADTGEDPTEVFDHIEQFVKENNKNSQLSADASGLAEAFHKVLLDYANRNADAPSDEALAVLDKSRAAVKAVKAIKLKEGRKQPVWSAIDQAETKLKVALARLKRRNQLLAEAAALAKETNYAGLLKLEEFVAAHAEEFPDLPTAKEVTDAFEAIYNGHKEKARYVKEPAKKKDRPTLEEDEPALLFGMLIDGGERVGPGNDDGTVLALSRGVLYALRRANGQVRWATRVGIDTTALPVRVPARAGLPELILVLSSDTATLNAYAIDNKNIDLRWTYRLPAPSLGQPVIVDGQAYLGTQLGEVHEIELSEGKLLGRYALGQRLTLGGTREPGSDLVYFAADEGCVYVLDVKKRECKTILYSRHPAGSLRCEPTLVPPQPAPEPSGDGVPGYLVLNQANGLREVRLRVFELPLATGASREVAPRQQPTLEGWTWFKPLRDPEKMVLLSDAGVLGLFGIKQANNPRDQALFRLTAGGGEALGGLLRNRAGAPATLGGRAEVVQLQGDDLWVLAGGRMQRLRLAWGPDVGPRLTPAWDAALELGSPLHQSQVSEDATGRTSLTVVTQPGRRAVVLATCLDDERGMPVHWQRQLGLVCQTEPLAIPVPGEAPLWLALDQSGALFALDPKRYELKADSTWLSDPRLKRLADSLDENADWPPVMLPAADGRSAYVLAAPGDGRELVVRHVTRVGRALRVTEGKAPLAAPPVGRPALVGGKLLVPLINGQLARLPAVIAEETKPESGPDWRSTRAAADAPGFVVALADGRFLITDGARGLNCYKWGEGEDDQHQKLPRDNDEPTLEMKDRIVTAPLRLPPAEKSKATDRVLVADSGGFLSLVEVMGNGALEVKREWDVGGTVTAGPFLRDTPDGPRVGCVVDRSRLVWIDPNERGLRWKYDADDSEIVGQPGLVAGKVVVVDQAGRYVALSPKDGKKVGAGHQLRGSVAPVASPVELLPGRAVAPLSDGTMLVLTLGEAKKGP